MNPIESNIAFTVLRQVLQIGGGIAVGKGWLDEAAATALVGAILALGSVVWGIVETRKKNAVVKAVAP